MTNGEWLVELRHLESQYNEKRWQLRNHFKRFVRNNPFSDKYTEEELITELEELSRIRKEMKKLSKDNNFKDEHDSLYHHKPDDFTFIASNPVW